MFGYTRLPDSYRHKFINYNQAENLSVLNTKVVKTQ